MTSVLDNLLNNFNRKCDTCLNLFYDTLRLASRKDIEDFKIEMKDMIIGGLFLNATSYWEKLLEDSFIAYMMGERSDNGKSVETYVSPKDNNHAYSIIKNITTYPDWTDKNKIMINANNYFKDGGPYSVLETLDQLNAIKKIRNAIAHTSQKARQDFENIVRSRIGHLPTDITPSVFLAKQINEKRTAPTFFEYYINYLKDSARMIVEFNPDR